MTPLVSILLPTIRADLFYLRMSEYAKLKLPGHCELIVISDRADLQVKPPQPDLSVKYLVQAREGNIAAINLGFAAAEGTYVYSTNDENELDPNIFYAHVAVADAHGWGLFATTQEPFCTNDYFGIFFANCPFGAKAFFEHLNGAQWFYDPAYKCFYGDPDLSIRAHLAGYPVVRVPEARCTARVVFAAEGHISNREAYYQRDHWTFRHRWANLGNFDGDPSTRHV